MAATYTPGGDSPLNRIRSRIGDVGPTFDMQDEEINAIIAKYGDRDERLAWAEAAEDLASRYNRKVGSFSRSGGIAVSWTDRARHLREMAATWRGEVRAAEEEAAGAITYQSARMLREGDDDEAHSEYRAYPGRRSWW